MLTAVQAPSLPFLACTVTLLFGFRSAADASCPGSVL
jgi:hypothetical protein